MNLFTGWGNIIGARQISYRSIIRYLANNNLLIPHLLKLSWQHPWGTWPSPPRSSCGKETGMWRTKIFLGSVCQEDSARTQNSDGSDRTTRWQRQSLYPPDLLWLAPDYSELPEYDNVNVKLTNKENTITLTNKVGTTRWIVDRDWLPSLVNNLSMGSNNMRSFSISSISSDVNEMYHFISELNLSSGLPSNLAALIHVLNI